MRDLWGHDGDTGCRGLERGTRVVRDGAVKIGHQKWKPSRGTLAKHEGLEVEVSVYDRHATTYKAREIGSLDLICYLTAVKE